MKSIGTRMTLVAASMGLALVLTAGNAMAGDRYDRGGYDRDRGGYDRDSHSSWRDYDHDRGHYRDSGRDDRGFRPYVVGGYRSVRPVYVESSRYHCDYVYERPCVERPCVEYVYPVCRERVYVRPCYRPSWSVGLYLGW